MMSINKNAIHNLINRWSKTSSVQDSATINDPVAENSAAAPLTGLSTTNAVNSSPKLAKQAIRDSLQASTMDGVFAAVYSNVTGGVILTNFVMDLGASPTQIGLLASIPLLANFLQPAGAYVSEQMTSRHWYCFWVYGPSRLVWLVLLVGVGLLQWGHLDPQVLVYWTLAIALVSYGVGALGSAAWLSWMAMLVPRRLRGRYFGLRNSAGNFTSLVSIPLAGLAIAQWHGGPIEGFGVVLLFGVVLGMVSLWFQNRMTDVNPKHQQLLHEPEQDLHPAVPVPVISNNPKQVFNTLEADQLKPDQLEPDPLEPDQRWGQNTDFWMFLIYFSVWMFAFSLSAPFFNLYMLDNLNLNISQVTLYNSMMMGANLLTLMIWGRLADRIGNRPLLILAGFAVALTPLLWLFMGTDQLSVWLWLPLLHMVMGSFAAAIDLCSNNLQIGIAPLRNQSTYFGWIAAASGVSGALGTTLGGYLAEHWQMGLLGLFTLSSLCRVGALFPLVFVREHRSASLRQLMQVFASADKSTPEVASDY